MTTHHQHYPHAGGSYSEEESATSASTPTPGKVKMWRCNFCQRVLKVPVDGDKRLASSYPSFVIGKLLSLIGSFGLLAGLTLRFFFLEDANVMRVISYFVVVASLVIFGIGAFLVIYATVYKTNKARKQFEYERTGKSGSSGRRPESTLSSTSIQSPSTSPGYFSKKNAKGNNVHTIQMPDNKTSINC
jgi:hypothetical protein